MLERRVRLKPNVYFSPFTLVKMIFLAVYTPLGFIRKIPSLADCTQSSAPLGGGVAPCPLPPTTNGGAEEEGGRRQSWALQYMRPYERSQPVLAFLQQQRRHGGKQTSGYLKWSGVGDLIVFGNPDSLSSHTPWVAAFVCCYFGAAEDETGLLIWFRFR